MRRRTGSRSRARSQTSMSAEEEDVSLGLQRLLDKLRQFQPLFAEEDVAAIPFPADSGGSHTSSPSISVPTSPRLSPSRLGNEELHAHQASINVGPSSSTPPSSPVTDRRGRRLPSPSTKAAAALHAVGTSIDLDGPLSSALFLTAVNVFDAKMLVRSKRVSNDALKLVRQAYALIWKDSVYLATLMNGELYRGANGPKTLHRDPGVTSVETVAARRSSHGSRHVPFFTAAPSPEQQPNRQLVLLLDECIRSLLVYANVSVNFCHSVSTNSRVLLLLSFVCCAARRLEEEDEVPYGEGRGSAADIIVGNRNLHTELDSLGQVWQGCGIEGRVADSLQECYLIEFLLDAALPPAVCSSRYEGLLTAVFEKKRRIITDIVASRSGFAHMMSVAPLRGLCGLVNMSAFGDAKLRARLLDKMAYEGVVERLASEIASAMEAILSVDDLTSPSCSPSKRQRPAVSRGTSPPHQRSRASMSGPPSSRTSLRASQSPHKSEGNARKRDEVGAPRMSTGLDRALNTQPTPVDRIGQCVDILMLLSSPNLCPPEGSEAPSSSPRTSTSSLPGAVRATTWASHEDALYSISLHLLAICLLSKTHARYAELASLQLYAADCVLQWAAYSGRFYTLVVHALDELLGMMEVRDSGIRRRKASPQPPLSPVPRSPPRCVPPTANESDGADTVPGHRLLRQLLPGDETGLLPLLTSLLQYTIHAEANAASIQGWFQFLADRVLPGVFEAPPLTAGRRSTSEWGRRHLGEQQPQRPQRSREGSCAPSSSHSLGVSVPTSLAEADAQALNSPVLARDLTRAEVAAVAPYFRFVRQVVLETSWRTGTAPLLAKVVLLAFNVIVTQGHRCNLIFGQACACYDVAAPLLLTMQGKGPLRGSRRSSTGRKSGDGSNSSSYRCSTILMHQLRSEEEEAEARRYEDESPCSPEGRQEGLDGNEEEVFIGSAAKRHSPSKRERRLRSPKKAFPYRSLSPTVATNEEQVGFSPFINSPSGSPVFYEQCSSFTADTELSRNDNEESRSPSDNMHRGSNLRAALEEAATPPPPPQSSKESPQPVTQSWMGRLSLRSLLSTFSGHEEAPLRK
ncbi:hypothetical protein ABL78_0790 [Leptomonas seymouri]|uniref:Uncharacterized protein n=1 Tax=Leptomonas seymouri TaxID=5684 RepID=A0A0N1I378_LEPSE|nr:hypothetical protein ABL78_0790 [Leptomonas seymouri]|eukprot:KPI90145.1 hypothetical protein ABL78_0790 [Leptomonas seymouri]